VTAPHSTALPSAAVLPSLGQLGRRGLPQAIEGGIVPAALFLIANDLAGISVAIVVGFAWTGTAIVRRILRSHRIPGMVIVGGLTLLVRSVVGLSTGSAVLYLSQPAIAAGLIAAAFLLSVMVGRPLAQRFAADFCTLPNHVLTDIRTRECFSHVSLMWAGVGFVNALLMFWLLISQGTTTYVVAQTALSIGVTVLCVAASLLWFRRSMTRHGLMVVA
jgi:intracellular septation protein A